MVHSAPSLRRVVFSSVTLSLLGGMSIAAGAFGTGCGSSDDTSTTTPPSDAGHDAGDATTAPSGDDSGLLGDDDSSVDAGPPFTIDASAAAMSIYAGQTAAIPASALALSTAATGVTYTWALTSAPAGSTASLAMTATGATLPTDKAGAYVVTVTAQDSAGTATASLTVQAYAANVVYAQSESLADGGFSGAGWVVGSDGTNAHSFTCPTSVPPIRQDETGDVRIAGIAKAGSDLLEIDAGLPDTVVYGGLPYAGDGGTYAPLVLTDTSQGCAGGTPSDGGVRTIYTGYLAGADSAGALHPRFSPDGTKVLFSIANTNPGSGADLTSYLAVVNIDGTSPTTIAAVVDKDAGIDDGANVGVTRQAEWIDATHVGWVRYDKGDAGFTWDVVTSSVPPAVGDPKVTMTCTSPGLTPNRAVFLKDGSVLTIGSTVTNAPADLLNLAPDTNGKCTVVHNLSKLGTLAGGEASVIAFALSPDQKTVAYSACDPVVTDSCGSGAGEQDLLYTVPVDGSAAPSVAPGKPLSAAGVRWIGDGTAIAFSRFPGTDAGGPTDGVPVVSVVSFQATTDAGIQGDVAIGDAATAVTPVGSGDGGCAVSSSGSESAPFGSMLLGVLGLAFFRRRKSAALASEI